MEKKTRSKKKYMFSLKIDDTDAIDQKYGITLVSNISTNSGIQPDNTTTITELSDLNKDVSLDIVSFLDESKRVYQCNVSMIDYSSGSDTITLRYKCFWCRHSFTSIPIGCPVKYVPNKVTKTYHSEITKDNYMIKENVTSYKREKLASETSLFMSKKTDIKANDGGYFICDGVFCSFNCIKAFIQENKHNTLYEHSDNLLIKLYNDMNDDTIKNLKINPAPSWRLLTEYGGFLTIEQFRSNFNKASYEFHGVLKNIFRPVGFLYEEKISF